MTVLLQAEDIHKTYVMAKKSVPVLKGASISVKEGETIAIIGASGAGKSTLLYVLGSLHKPEQGTVTIGGKDVYSLSESWRSRLRSTQIGFVFQSYHLLPEMDILDNVMLPSMASGHAFSSRSKMCERAREVLAAVGLADRADHMPMELSGGEQQRAAIARALINEPKLVLADEPTGNLDNVTGTQVLDYLFSLTKGRGHTLVLVTHNEKVAASCDRTLRLKEGLVVPA
jgi:predicted ABC-type transport system involved in lysophospholipase L1 biosynthesis ATPase subunit